MATKELVAPFAIDPIMFGRMKWSFRHPEYQNLFTGDDLLLSSSSIFGHQGGAIIPEESE